MKRNHFHFYNCRVKTCFYILRRFQIVRLEDFLLLNSEVNNKEILLQSIVSSRANSSYLRLF
jgi:hypothetical protein